MTFNFFDKSDHDLEPPDDLLESAPDPPVMETSGTGDQCDPAQHRGIVLTFYGDRPAIDRDIYRSDLISAEVWAIRLVASCSIDDRLQQRQDQPLFIKLTTEPGPDCDRHPSSQSATHSIRIDLYLTPDRLRQFDLRPLELWPLLEQAAVALRPTGDRLVTALQLVLQQMVCCSFEGAMRQMYLESKSVELLMLWLEQQRAAAPNLESSLGDSSWPIARKDVDRDRIYQARDILLRTFQNPPSLKELAHQVGLNDCTLKRQFKQVFGTTVFGYLYDYRMEQARRWLLEQPWSVTEVARRVGYTNLCAFSTAFRKKFGVSPRSLQRQRQLPGDR